MTELFMLDTFFTKRFIVTDGDAVAYDGTNWEEAREAYKAITGEAVEEPTADLAERFALLERLVSDAE